MVKVLLVDDQVSVRRGVQRILNQEADLEVIGECKDGNQVVASVTELQPDVVLMDVRMKQMDGISAVKALQKLAVPPPVAMLTTFSDDEVLWNALTAGASGFVLKDASPEDLIRATHVIAAGGAWLDPAVTDKVIEFYRAQQRPQKEAISYPHVEPLTVREREVLVLIAEGLLNHEIAAQIRVSEATVKTHISHIFGKLGARDRAAAIVYAYDQGIVQPRR